jgi:hypothetical protein
MESAIGNVIGCALLESVGCCWFALGGGGRKLSRSIKDLEEAFAQGIQGLKVFLFFSNFSSRPFPYFLPPPYIDLLQLMIFSRNTKRPWPTEKDLTRKRYPNRTKQALSYLHRICCLLITSILLAALIAALVLFITFQKPGSEVGGVELMQQDIQITTDAGGSVLMTWMLSVVRPGEFLKFLTRV